MRWNEDDRDVMQVENECVTQVGEACQGDMRMNEISVSHSDGRLIMRTYARNITGVYAYASKVSVSHRRAPTKRRRGSALNERACEARGVSFGGGWGPQVRRGIVCMTPHIIFD